MTIALCSIDLQNFNPKKTALTIKHSSSKSSSKLFLLDLFRKKYSLQLFKYQILDPQNKSDLDFGRDIKILQNLNSGITKS